MFSGMLHLCSMFHSQLVLLREIFQRNGYPEKCIDRYFRLFLNRIHILKEKVPTVEKKPLQLVLPRLGTMSLQTRTKSQKAIISRVLLKPLTTDPPTTYPPTHRPNIVNLRSDRRPNSEHVLHFIIFENCIQCII